MANPRRKVKFSAKEHAKKGIGASVFALFSGAFFTAVLLDSYLKKGQAGNVVGILGFISIVLGLIGFILGTVSFKEKEKKYMFSVIGTAVNAVLLIVWFSIYIKGFYGA